ncbi:MAG: LAGLIDADG family homing endonuclease [Nanoarchaeota archaeon]
MRIVLEKGKQKELILKAKKDKTWKELAKILDINEQYLYRELRNERGLLSEKIYNNLSRLINEDFNQFIREKLSDNWGRIKGGLNSHGSTKILPEIKFDWRLAEFIGAVLGDGHVEHNKEKGVYHIRISGDLIKDKDYHAEYLKNLIEEIFKLKAVEIKRYKSNERFLDIYSVNLVKFFMLMGINAGDKIKNQSTIPLWVWKDKNFLKACIRGLIDTDGSIFRMSRKDPNLFRISFTNHNKTLLQDTRRALIEIGFNPSKIIDNRQFYLSKQDEIKKYLKEVGFSNNKHIERQKMFTSPMV